MRHFNVILYDLFRNVTFKVVDHKNKEKKEISLRRKCSNHILYVLQDSDIDTCEKMRDAVCNFCDHELGIHDRCGPFCPKLNRPADLITPSFTR